jgi:dUTP pyrophosphatase
MKVRFKKLSEEAVLPAYASEGDAGLDLVATSKEWDKERGFVEFGIGLAVELPKWYVGLVFPRSSISKTKYTLANSVGVIDSGYRGEIKLRFFLNSAAVHNLDGESRNEFSELTEYTVGDKIGQLVILPYLLIEPEEVNELSDSKRGGGGFGSTDE